MLSKFILLFWAGMIALVCANVVKEYPSHFLREYNLGAERETDWWENAIVYQIYPRSFRDVNGDGYGDILGITAELENLKEVGVQVIWLSPINTSPGVDQGYDISDYRDVDPLFGNINNLRELLSKAHSLGIKIILDFVPNHTSNQHPWFIKSENGQEGYEDYYIWVDGVPDPKNKSKLTVPNNWLSDFMGSAWKWSEKRRQFYYHQFSEQQVDLNYRNPKVLQEIKDILTYWMDFGMDGFRIDACPYLLEDEELKDEPLTTGKDYHESNPACLQHIYTKNQPGSYDVIYSIREHIDDYTRRHNISTKLIMSEAYTSIDYTMLFYQSKDGTRQGSHLGFNFNFILYLKHLKPTIDEVLFVIHLWLDNLPQGHVSNWVLGNHDNHRIASRLGLEYVDGLNMLTAFLPGVMVTYNGEEIGMKDGEVDCQHGRDPQAIKNCSMFKKVSRDFERTPYQWNSNLNAGFSNNPYFTWLPVSQDYKIRNLELQKNPSKPSHFHVYRHLAKFRKNFDQTSKYHVLKTGKLLENILQLIRILNGQEYQYLYNIGDNPITVHPKDLKYATYILVVVSSNSNKVKEQEVKELELKPHECVILKKIDNVKSN